MILEIVNNLQQIINNSNDNIMIQSISNIIIKMNNVINDNKKNTQLIINQVTYLQNQITFLQNQISQLNKNIQELNNNKINKEIKYDNGSYVGQVVNGLREGK